MSLSTEIIKAVRAEWPDVRCIYLFGSVASHDERPDSDLDIAVLGPACESLPSGLANELSRVLKRDVDLVDLRKVSTILQKEVISSGVLLWSEAQLETAEFELFIWASYQKLCAERADILSAGQLSGRFYNP